MIRSQKLSYARSESILSSWEPENSALNVVLIATLTMFLSYKLIAVTFNLLLGIKNSRETRYSDLHALLLVRNFSPLAVTSSLIRNDTLTRLRFKLPSHTWISRDDKRIPICATIKLLLLVLIVPVANIMAVILALENDRVISLREARFGGVEMGFAKDADGLRFNPLSEECTLARLGLQRGETRKSDFSLCRVHGELLRPELKGLASLTAVRSSNFILGFEVVVNGQAKYLGKLGFMRVEDRGRKVAYLIPVRVDMEALERFVDVGMDMLATQCDTRENATDISGQLNYEGTTTTVLKAKIINCTEGEVWDVAERLADYISFVESPDMRVFEIDDNGNGLLLTDEEIEFIDAGKFPLFVRRRRNVSLLFMAICAAIGALAHTVTAFVCHNDVDLGIEAVMKKALGLGCCESGLLEQGVVHNYHGSDFQGCVQVKRNSGSSEGDSMKSEP